MSPETQTLEFNKLIKATPAQIFNAFSNATALKEWLCDVATLVPRTGGRIYLAWNSGYYMAGEFTQFNPDEKLAFTWNGRNEPGSTEVEILLAPHGSATNVKLLHHGFGEDGAWANMIEETRHGWTESLDNLASVLGEGPDLRIVQRPMLGILVGDFDQAQADRLGVPVSKGIRLDSVIESMGAYAAGLRKDDVVVAVDGKTVPDFPSLASALSRKKGGDTVKVEFYRGAEKQTVLMELSKRPIPEIPASVTEMSEKVHKRYTELQTQLDQILEGVSEVEAAHKPTPEAWSANEILTHLIHTERDNQNFLAQNVGGQLSWSDDFTGNLQMRNNATLSAFPTLKELREELRRLYIETVGSYECIPSDFPQQRKGAWWGIGYGIGEAPYHEIEHFEQINLAIQSARS